MVLELQKNKENTAIRWKTQVKREQTNKSKMCNHSIQSDLVTLGEGTFIMLFNTI